MELRDNGSDLRLLALGQKLVVEATKDTSTSVSSRWTMKTLPEPKITKSLVRFNSIQMERDGVILKCKELDMVDGVLMFDVSLLIQMLPSSRIVYTGDELSVWHWGNCLIANKGSDKALVDFQELKLPAFTKPPLFELPVLWTLKNLGVKHKWDESSKTLTVEEQALPIPHQGNYELLEIKGKVVYSGVGLVKINDGKKDILVYPSNLGFVANSKKNDTVWVYAMKVGENHNIVYSDLILTMSDKKPSILSVKVTKTNVNGNPRCFETLDAAGKTWTLVTGSNIKPGNCYKVSLTGIDNQKIQFIATSVEGVDHL